ncbi:winged helix-turn-helix domain-containing protein (plasmid) [Mesorhizobium sp. AR07]|uniref:ATP-binding response regulator n=1 Tax=Mesorhizobium sp. AR07 TaxID=2865838 RepID=UPI00215E2EA8|nr:winged helix-turn-helix domain-containing protein [Mesorhizobium sp. AR07]UVK48055.1 winged helix-turn-helix domain-containing protein [Mesorhizobium sp. AR07]
MGHAIHWAKDLSEARDKAGLFVYDLVLLDIDLPDGNGIDYLREMMKWPVPVIIWAGSEQDGIEGLNAGAADYLVKPFIFGALFARIHAVGRRHEKFPEPYCVGRLYINEAERCCERDGQRVYLTRCEWTVTTCLRRRPGAVVSKATIEEELSSLGSEIESNTVEVYISRLRKKIGRDRIATVRGVGYSFVPESDTAPVDLVREVRSIVNYFLKKPWFTGRIILDDDGCPPLVRKFEDVLAVSVALHCLIENALTHGLPDTPATVSLRANGTIAIVNGGPVVPLPDPDELEERHRRRTEADSGFDLSLANQAIKDVKGSLEFASPAPGREDGFETIIRIPQ